MPKIFISYRREDTGFLAIPVRDRLAAHYGQREVFFDVDAIPLGYDFAAEIDRKVASCDYFVALIGEKWLTAADEENQRRIDDPDDWVRLEIESALKRGIPVIPVLFNVRMPKSAELPDSLAALSRRQAHWIRPLSDFNHDVDRLVQDIDRQERQRSDASQDLQATPKPVLPLEAGQEQKTLQSETTESILTPRARTPHERDQSFVDERHNSAPAEAAPQKRAESAATATPSAAPTQTHESAAEMPKLARAAAPVLPATNWPMRGLGALVHSQSTLTMTLIAVIPVLMAIAFAEWNVADGKNRATTYVISLPLALAPLAGAALSRIWIVRSRHTAFWLGWSCTLGANVAAIFVVAGLMPFTKEGAISPLDFAMFSGIYLLVGAIPCLIVGLVRAFLLMPKPDPIES
jgi:hypothetical protein